MRRPVEQRREVGRVGDEVDAARRRRGCVRTRAWSTTCSSNSAASGACSENASAPKLMLPCTSSAGGPDPVTETCRSDIAGFKHGAVRTPP